ncbi:hypothetical protein PsalN5692_04101 (plasmid) [Piscirickettsia salmonis]|uniref:type II toxin-antitoxin system HicA family toxin n=1 Tax=Piscirickettsia salmonis TaxID=1238 RepID=UPI0018ACB24E|nr:type II toxin-antitoxin system HicA family toxin [Piscirickettsia salmonis]QGP52592.1 hypothetical protein PsalN5692_04101 [Piscirickettsia salmonis]
MNNKHRKTLKDIFHNPIKASIVWSDIEKLLLALEAEVVERDGSRVAVILNGVKTTFHRPHPEKTTDKGAVKSIRMFLKNAGVDKNA